MGCKENKKSAFLLFSREKQTWAHEDPGYDFRSISALFEIESRTTSGQYISERPR